MDKIRVKTLEDLIAATEKICGLKKGDILSDCRKREIILARQCVAKIAYDDLRGYSSVSIGEVMGRDHATILYARNKVRHAVADYRTNKDLYTTYHQIMADIWIFKSWKPTAKMHLSIFDISRMIRNYSNINGTHIERLRVLRRNYESKVI